MLEIVMPVPKREVMSHPSSFGETSIYGKTRVIKIDPSNPDLDLVRIAAEVIKGGGLVAFPTETVYGLGADALNAEAVARIFEAKGRPADNPIIIHIGDRESLYRLAKRVPESAKILMERFWPGPLTLILERSRKVPDITVAGLDTVAVRMPSHEVALALIRLAGTPIAAPSANLAGRPSPTTAGHVLDDLDGRIDIVLDAGPTQIGVESTVLDLTVEPPQILRPGGTPYERLKEALGEVELHPMVLAEGEMPIARARSPGMKHRHYAPEAEMVLVEGESDKVVAKVKELADKYCREGKKVGILTTNENLQHYEGNIVKSFGKREDFTEIARNLFKLLREFDEEGVNIIVAEGVMPKQLGLAVLNRLRKASGYKIIKV